jgi:hypothetical protein
MLTLITAIVSFALQSADPASVCELTHRDPDIRGTYYLYCAQTTDGVEQITVGRFISDAKAAL